MQRVAAQKEPQALCAAACVRSGKHSGTSQLNTLLHTLRLSGAVCTRRRMLHTQDEVVIAKAIELLDGLVGVIPASEGRHHGIHQHGCIPSLHSTSAQRKTCTSHTSDKHRRPHLYTKLTKAKPRDSPVSRSYAMYIREMGPKALKSSCAHMAAHAQHKLVDPLPAGCLQLDALCGYGRKAYCNGKHTRRSSSRVSSDRLVTRTLFSSRLCMESPIVAPPPAARALHMRMLVAFSSVQLAGPEQMQLSMS